MARSAIPDPLKRRHLLEGKLDSARALAVAEAYLGEERRVEALPFLVRAEAREQLVTLRDEAVAAGDAFLARECAAALKEALRPEHWKALADAARAAGREHDLAEAERQVARRES